VRFGDSRRLEAEIRAACEEAKERSMANQSRLAQLVTILASGYLEATCREVLTSYAEKHAEAKTFRFVSRNLERFTNPRMQRIIEPVGSFDKDSAKQLEAFASDGIKESVDGIVTQRNSIAHGRRTDTTLVNVSRQFDDARRLAGKLNSLFR